MPTATLATQNIKLSPDLQTRLRCPACASRLSLADGAFRCTISDCRAEYPIVDGIPVLIDNEKSVFEISDFERQQKTTMELQRPRALETIARFVPNHGVNLKARKNYDRLGELLTARTTSPTILVVGGSILGEGMEGIVQNRAIRFVETDVSYGPRTQIICDSHDIPFEDETFDGAIVQAVLEHVVDPYRCVAEIHRVLKPGGLVYAETPFMQQVHLGRFDFTRFTHLGHRRLFRWFTEIESGANCGPGMALAWSWQYFLLSFNRRKALRPAVMALARLSSFYLKYFDRLLIDRPAALDAASGVFFLGEKSDRPLPDKELLRQYRGAI